MKEKHPDNKDGYRQGFHRPPRNIKYHLHMHCIVLPLKTERWNIIYGENLDSVEEVLNELDEAISLVKKEQMTADEWMRELIVEIGEGSVSDE